MSMVKVSPGAGTMYSRGSVEITAKSGSVLTPTIAMLAISRMRGMNSIFFPIMCKKDFLKGMTPIKLGRTAVSKIWKRIG